MNVHLCLWKSECEASSQSAGPDLLRAVAWGDYYYLKLIRGPPSIENGTHFWNNLKTNRETLSMCGGCKRGWREEELKCFLRRRVVYCHLSRWWQKLTIIILHSLVNYILTFYFLLHAYGITNTNCTMFSVNFCCYGPQFWIC